MSLMGQYEYVIDTTHPRANEDGQVYLHIIVAERKLGRKLLCGETVHHKDLDKLNNNPENLIVFATKADHTRFHSLGCNEDFLELTENGAYICKQKIHVCVDCGVKITHGAKRCVECRLKNERKTRPTKEQLEDFLVKNNGNFSRVGQTYGVTDNAIRKWCLFYGLSSHSKDYKH